MIYANDPNLRYITFGSGSVLGRNYMVAYAKDENELRHHLNEKRLPWCGIYTWEEFKHQPKEYDLQRLAQDFEVVNQWSAGPFRMEIEGL